MRVNYRTNIIFQSSSGGGEGAILTHLFLSGLINILLITKKFSDLNYIFLHDSFGIEFVFYMKIRYIYLTDSIWTFVSLKFQTFIT